MKIGCIIMAAGNSSRFGGNKLAAELGGVPLIRRALDAVPGEKFERVALVTQYAHMAELAKDRGFLAVTNREPALGVSHTIRLGLEVLGDVDTALFMVADQPLLRRETVAKLVDFYRQDPERIAALGHNGQRGNPVVFPGKYFLQLLALTGDRGGSAVIKKYPNELRILEASADELMDVDTAEALREVEKWTE